MPDPRQFTAGSSSLVLGVDSYTQSAELDDKEFIMGLNVTVRGGIVQTRPGTRSLFCLPDGNFQGCTLFTPDNGVAQLVFAVNGKIYVSAAPFTTYRQLFNLQFSITSKYLAWAVCLKSTDYDNAGNLYSLAQPYSVLVMQDGVTRAAYWDGGTSGHLNPSPSPTTGVVVPGYEETPVGLWMIWSGNRLWVSRENQIFASDIGNPLKFTEGIYLNNARAFYLSGPCTGITATPDQQGIIAFTENNGTFLQSSIQVRSDWLNTPDFQKLILPNAGCVAPRSLVTQYGLNWWFGSRGLTNLNAAFRQNLSSRLDYQDNEMFASKAYLGPDLSGVCGSFYENYLMMSVPSGDVLNRHTWVLDQAPFEGNVNSWTGFWSGWRPIEWCRGIVNGSERSFFGSVDYDGKNRIWEAMLPERTDNGCRITCYAQLRDHAAGNLDPKKYDWSKFFLSQLYGEVDLNVYMAATKGGYQLQKQYHLIASEGQIFSDTEYSELGPYMIGNRVQSRVIRTPDAAEDDECNKCGVESQEGNKIDYAFSHLLVWSGQMGLRAYQIHMHEEPDKQTGDCAEDEVGPHTLNAMGCSGLELLVDGQVFETFEGVAEGFTTLSNGATVYIRRVATSVISQANATAMAECAVQQIKNHLIGRDVAAGVHDSNEAEVGNGSYVIVQHPQDTTDVGPTPPGAPYDVDYLLVAGGGGGGATNGFLGGGGCGGGGAGGMKESATTVTPGVVYPVVVGTGGAAGPQGSIDSGDDGLDSTFDGDSATGGGGGGGAGFGSDGRNGGSGGGGSGFGTANPGGLGVVGQGNDGGGGVTGATDQGGGGGGAGAVGGNGGGGSAGDGGNGLPSSMSGAAVTYAGGGGGGVDNGAAVSPGGTGGGGAGANNGTAGVNGTDGLGAGGGAGSIPMAGGDGGDGIVIIRYPGAQRGTGGVVTSSGGNTIHTFTTSGNYTA